MEVLSLQGWYDIRWRISRATEAVCAADAHADWRDCLAHWYERHVAQEFYGWGVAKLVKAPDFDSGIRRFESFFPSHLIL